MGAFSSNGTASKGKARKGGSGRFLKGRARISRGVEWNKVDGDTLRMVIDALTYQGHMIGFAQAAGGVGVKLMIWADGNREDAFLMDAGELNDTLAEVLADLQAGDDSLRQMFEDVSAWLESRDTSS